VAWPPWSKSDEKDLTRYVVDGLSEQVKIRLVDGRTAGDLHAAGDYRRLVRELYEALCGCDVRWNKERYHPERETQIIRNPETIIHGSGDGTCLDLALLFAGLALGNRLLPLIVVLNGHALVAVSLVTERRNSDSYARAQAIEDGGEGSNWWDPSGFLTDPDILRQLVDSGRYVLVECTGFARTTQALSDANPEGQGRAGGLLAWDRAVAAGREQLDQPGRPFRFAVDPAYLQDVRKIGVRDPVGNSAGHDEDPVLRDNFVSLLEDPDYAVFAGREDALEVIEDFLAGPGGILAVTAPAGLGKTVLLASLVREDPDRFAHHFLSARYDHGAWLDESFFLRSMLQQLDPPGGSRRTLDLPSLRAGFRHLLAGTGPSPGPRALLIDALDEVSGWSPADYLAGPLSDGVHVILSVRDTGQDWRSDYRLRTAQQLLLDGFDRDAVAAVFTATGEHAAELIRQPGALDTIMGKTAYTVPDTLGGGPVIHGADPLYVRLLAEDANVTGYGLDDLQRQPEGFTTYLDRWWKELGKAVGKKIPLSLFAALTAAFGPLTREDLAGVVPDAVNDPKGEVTDWFDRKVLPRIRRFVTGNDAAGYSLAHPRLRQHLSTKLTPALRENARKALLDHCRHWADRDSLYAITYYPSHLADVDPSSLPGLYREAAYLERAISALGIHRVTGTLRTVLSTAVPADLKNNLNGCLRLLDREAHHLRHPFPYRSLGYVSRQLRLQALSVGDSLLADSARQNLLTMPPGQLIPEWTTNRTNPAFVRVLGSYSDYVHAVGITPDSTRALTAGNDTVVRIWELDTGKELHTLTGHTGAVYALDIFRDGKRAITAGYDTVVRIWNLDTGKEIHAVTGFRGPVHTMVTTPDGARALTAGLTTWDGWDDTAVRVWDLDTGMELHTLAGNTRRRVHAVAVTPDGKRALTVGELGTVRIWNLKTGKKLRTLAGHTGEVYAVAITPDGTRAVTAGDDRTVRIWDLKTGKETHTLTGHTGPVYAVAITPDGTRALTSGWLDTVRAWDLDTGKELEASVGDTDVKAVVITPDGTRALTSGDHGTVRIWDLDTGKELGAPAGGTLRVSTVAITPDGTRALTTAADDTARIWDLDTGKELHTLTGHTGAVYAAYLTPDGTRALTIAADNTARIWDLDTGKELHTLTGHTGAVHAAYLTPDGTRALTTAADNTIRIWNLDTGKELHTLHSHTDAGHAAAITRDGTRAVTGSGVGTVRIWNLDTGKALHTLTGRAGPVNGVAITPDGARAVTGSGDGTVRIWNVDTGKELHTLTGHTDLVYTVAVTPDGARALSTSWDGTVRIWDLETGKVLHALIGHTGAVYGVCIIGDGVRALTTGADSTIRLWNLYDGKQLQVAAMASSISAVEAIESGGKIRVIVGESAGHLTVFTACS
jgi:WD40 repeat protein